MPNKINNKTNLQVMILQLFYNVFSGESLGSSSLESMEESSASSSLEDFIVKSVKHDDDSGDYSYEESDEKEIELSKMELKELLKSLKVRTTRSGSRNVYYRERSYSTDSDEYKAHSGEGKKGRK